MTRRPTNDRTVQLEDPRDAGPRPPFPEQQQEHPGSERELEPKADHGEESYIGGTGRLAGLSALVTGADSGIGRAVALAFAREGADVVVSYLSERQDAAETIRLVEEAGRRAVDAPGDIADEGTCGALVRRAVDEFGRIDLLVNNAAHQQSFRSILEIDTPAWDRTMRTNLYAMFWLCRESIPHMREGGSIINVASVQAYDPSPTLLPYATTKGGIITFTKAIAQELAPKGIRANVVAPGPVWTPLIPHSTPPEDVAEFGRKTALGRPAQPAELAPAFVFLASEEARYITGTTLVVAGGMPLP